MKAISLMGICMAAIVAALAAPAARADSVTATFDGVDSNAAIVGISMGGTNYGLAYAGALHWTVSDGQSDAGRTFWSYCIDIKKDVWSHNTYTYDLVDLADAGGLAGAADAQLKAARIERLWQSHYADSVSNPTLSAAFQIGVWEIVYGSQLTVSPYSGGNWGDTVTAWLGELGSATRTNALRAMTSPTAQDQAIFGGETQPPHRNDPPVVPLPSAAAAGMMLLAGLFAVRIKRAVSQR